MNASPPPTSSRLAAVYQWFGHPLIAIIASLCAIISVPLAIYYGIMSEHSPGLTYFVYPVRTAVIRAAELSDFAVTFAKKPLTGDVTTAQVSFWNAGDAPIHASTVLKPLRIYTRPASAILEVQVRKVSRDVVASYVHNCIQPNADLGR